MLSRNSNQRPHVYESAVLTTGPQSLLFCMSLISFSYFKHVCNFTRVQLLLDFSLTVKAATLIFISGCGSTISSAKEGKSGFIYNLVKS